MLGTLKNWTYSLFIILATNSPRRRFGEFIGQMPHRNAFTRPYTPLSGEPKTRLICTRVSYNPKLKSFEISTDQSPDHVENYIGPKVYARRRNQAIFYIALACDDPDNAIEHDDFNHQNRA